MLLPFPIRTPLVSQLLELMISSLVIVLYVRMLCIYTFALKHTQTDRTCSDSLV